MSEREIFTAALKWEAATERAAFLDEACAGDAALRSRVESLLAEHQQLGSFMERSSLPVTVAPPQERAGTSIGPYKLLQQIGEGGMGTVFMAEQHAPVKRRVALKVIKLGMDTRQVIARFEAERQALTLMDHPNIAKVLDAGTTDSGRPYFVMELVKGQPITQYCDERRLTPRQRLELLIPVCQAIQHAHQKGIIHRDIKPTNILVAEYDEHPVPKVIDFGVAKATSQTLTEKTMFTGLGQIVGTLEYMSPEQAKVNQLDIDTRSDIYSLGVLLYELLTGSTPLTHMRMRETGYAEILRRIKDEEPPRPSVRLSDSGEALATISAQRKLEPTQLKKMVRGELDWIVMKTLEKDRNRRYETANSLAADLQRYLADEPVQACPPSAVYRLRKFLRRHRSGMLVSAGLAVMAAVLASGASFYFQAAREAEEGRRESEHAQNITKAHEKIPQIQAAMRQQQFDTAFDLLKEIEPLIPDHPSVPELEELCSQSCSISSIPTQVDVWVRRYDQPEAPWRHVFQTVDRPMTARIPRGEYLWRATKTGYRTVTGLRPPRMAHFTVDREGDIPSDMVRVPKGRPNRPGMAFSSAFQAIELPEFLVDRYEVSNSQYDQFVKAGGYGTPEYWADLPFVDMNGQSTSKESVMPLLVDQTGHPGPATWRAGSFQPGEEDHPVRGVSWYEAMAFARFAGKSLPTIYHWTQASQVELSVVLAGNEFISRSNFGPQVKSVRALRDEGIHGTIGTIGNVKEWCFNDTNDGKRFILGGACGEPIYLPLTLDSNHPLQRDEFSGFRCVKFINDEKGPAAAWEQGKSIPWPIQPKKEELMDASTFRLVIQDRFVYDRSAPLDVASEQIDEGDWIHETAFMNTAYRDAEGRWERMAVHLYLPKGIDTRKGYQAVLYCPGGDAQLLPRIRPIAEEYGLNAIVRGGRAVVCPVYQGMYERRYVSHSVDAKSREERRLGFGQDMMRAIDYLEQRGDIRLDQLGYYGFSLGAEWAGSLVAVEPRLRAVVFEAGGLLNTASLRKERLLLETRHYLPHIQVPVLMLNGENDPVYPVKESQDPMFNFLGSTIKEHYVHPNGNHMLPPSVKFEHIQRWFDQHLGTPERSGNRGR